MLDFAAIKRSITLEEAVKLLNLPMKQVGNQLRGRCPACESGTDRALTVTPGIGFYCFASKAKGSVIDLAAHVRKVSVRDAAAFLSPEAPPAAPQAPQRPQNGFDRAKYQGNLDRAHELLKDIPEALRERADIGVSNRGTHKGLINIPLYDKDTGEFLCYAGVPSIKLPNIR